MAVFITTAVRSSNPTYYFLFKETVLTGYFSSSSHYIIKHDPSINMALKELGRSKTTACSNGGS
jgi:hypothetical protein